MSISDDEGAIVYFTDRGIEELAERRGDEQVSLDWLSDKLQVFVDVHPEFETAVERFATWLARQGDDDDGIDDGFDAPDDGPSANGDGDDDDEDEDA